MGIRAHPSSDMAEIQIQDSADPWAHLVALGDLAALKQTGTVSGFTEQFDLVFHQTTLTEKQAVCFFVDGLKEEIQPTVRLFKPQSLYDAYCLAFLQESCLEDVQGIANTPKPILEQQEIPRAVGEIAQVAEAEQEKTTAGERDKLAAVELDQKLPLVTPIADDGFPISCEVAKDEPTNESAGMVQNQPPALEIAHAMEGESTLLSQGDQVVEIEQTFGELNSSTHKLFDEMLELSGLETTSISRRQYTDRLKSWCKEKVHEDFDPTLVTLGQKGMADEYLEPLALLFPKPGLSISLSLTGIKAFVNCDGGSLTRPEGMIDLLGMEVAWNADKKSSKGGSVHGHLVQDDVLVSVNWKVIIQILKLDSIITGNQNLESWSSLEMNPLSLISKHVAWAWVLHENRNVGFWNVESRSKTTGNRLYLY
ncbi:hypothetical protein SLEP1_g42380 [Rubroshorea leprosula]|uniref:Uncharacterized protein n=1 Tax=Rubroshorea leprosula TaxID=152421 RepID=A0AAV5L9L2_9ROSI|nr:hypothetical protein SLEP1_g42380 [Rubroshorea leprosula]